MDKRPGLFRPQCAQDWENQKTVIMELYESKTLTETMRIMEAQHSFKATCVTITCSVPYTYVRQDETVQATVAEVGFRP